MNGTAPSALRTSDRTLASERSTGARAVELPTPGYSPAFVRWFTRIFWLLARPWFRPRVEGLDRIPSAPCMVVGNHSGYGVMEIFVLLSVWTRRHGTHRPVVGLSHDVGMTWPLRWGVTRIGGVRASPKVARDALGRGFDVLVFPGGDVDALRPFSARYQVHWSGRAGFVRTAADAGVPIVPMANCGSHAQFTLLKGGPAIARLIGLTRFRINSWPLPLGSFAVLATALGWALGALSPWWLMAGLLCAFVPNPTRMQIRFLQPIDAAELLRAHGGNEAAAAESLRTQLESTLGALAVERKTAWG